MDNVTHALAGMVVAEVAVQRRGGRDALPRSFPAVAYVLSAAANNVPDLDLLYLGITEGRIGYLVHHRGHTHTFAFALPLALLTLAPAWAYAKRRGFGSRDRGTLLALALLGPVLHLALDLTNNYGIHPFWPFDNRWFYGDAIFIIEPLLWASVCPALFFAVRARVARIGFALIAGAGVGLSALSGRVPLPLVGVLAGWTILTAAIAARVSAARRVGVAGAAVALVYALFFGAGRRAKAQVADVYAARFPSEVLREVVTAPAPANPLCWMVIGISDDGRDAVLRRGVATPFGLERLCPVEAFMGRGTAPLTTEPPTRPPLPERFAVNGVFRAPLAEFRALARGCHGAAFLQWGRAPFWRRLTSGETVLGDLRYDFEPEVGWAEVALPPDGAACPRNLPAWTPPRRDWIDP